MEYREMTEADVLAFLQLLDDLGIGVWLDGGWGVDALLGEQTRRHADLDIVVEASDVPSLVQHLSRRGFSPVPRPDTSPWNFVYGDATGRDVDVHVIERRSDGDGTHGPDHVYPAAALTGTGVIGARPVRCISPGWAVRFHTGYGVDAADWADVQRLCARFDLPIPAEYDRFRASDDEPG